MNRTHIYALTLFAIIANIQTTRAELVVQVSYLSHQIMQEGLATELIDPNFIITVGNPYIEQATTGYIDSLTTHLSCDNTQLTSEHAGSQFFSTKHYQSPPHIIDSKHIWPNGSILWLHPSTLVCQYNWQYRLYRAKNSQPILALGQKTHNDNTQQTTNSNMPTLQMSFVLTKP